MLGDKKRDKLHIFFVRFVNQRLTFTENIFFVRFVNQRLTFTEKVSLDPGDAYGGI